jgi:hypothetical protein
MLTKSLPIVCSLFLAGCFGLPAAPSLPALEAPIPVAAVLPSKPAEGRLDLEVRDDLFEGVQGNWPLLEKAMARCRQALVENPRDAEAMAWLASGTLRLAGRAFEERNFRKGRSLWAEGLAGIEGAVALAPNDIGVLIPVGAVFIGIGLEAPGGNATTYLSRGVRAYERVLAVQAKYFASLSTHARGELLLGLAQGWEKLGEVGKAEAYWRRIAAECEDEAFPEYAAAAKAHLAGKPSAKPLSCLGCHG